MPPRTTERERETTGDGGGGRAPAGGGRAWGSGGAALGLAVRRLGGGAMGNGRGVAEGRCGREGSGAGGKDLVREGDFFSCFFSGP